MSFLWGGRDAGGKLSEWPVRTVCLPSGGLGCGQGVRPSRDLWGCQSAAASEGTAMLHVHVISSAQEEKPGSGEVGF